MHQWKDTKLSNEVDTRVVSDVKILAVDDREENLFAISAILEPLGHDLHLARSGEDALRQLLVNEYAVVLMDVQMPGMDGFETARIIKSRARNRHMPIIFLTAISKEDRHVFEGYSVGAIDYMFKPYDPVVLRSKVAVLVELYEKTQEIARQGSLLRAAEQREREREVAAVREAGEHRYRLLAEAMPQIVWTATPDGVVNYFNDRWTTFTGMDLERSLTGEWRQAIHPEDHDRMIEVWEGAGDKGAVIETEARFRRADGEYRWHLARALPTRDVTDAIIAWVGTLTDIHDRRRGEDTQRLLAEVGSVLGSSLDFRETLQRMVELCVPRFADWCAVELYDVREFEEEGGVPELVARCARPGMTTIEREQLSTTLGSSSKDAPLWKVVKSGSAVEDPGDPCVMCAPLVMRGRMLGAMTFAIVGPKCDFGEADKSVVLDLAHRAAAAVDNATLYHQAEERAQAAAVIASIGDGVLLIDRGGYVRLFNPAAERITGLRHTDMIGKRAADAIPGWRDLRETVPLQRGDKPIVGSIAETMPFDLSGREVWLSISGVAFDQGTVYAFRDMTDEHAVERMKSDFVATVSHELRTPLSSIYGAAATMQRSDIELDESTIQRLMSIISDQSQRLADIVNDVLLASRVDAGHMSSQVRPCNPGELTGLVVDAARARAPETHTVEFDVPNDVPSVVADPGHLRQVLANLIDNAIKYSPDGGCVAVRIEPNSHDMRFAVCDEGFGIPLREQRRIFEKFYRVDAKMNTGIGGTGLGLYICRELVRQMHGKLWLESEEGKGSTFYVSMPIAVVAPPSGGTTPPAVEAAAADPA